MNINHLNIARSEIAELLAHPERGTVRERRDARLLEALMANCTPYLGGHSGVEQAFREFVKPADRPIVRKGQ